VAGLPAIAASQDEREGQHGDMDFAARVVAQLAQRTLVEGLPPDCMLNVNFPALPPPQVAGLQLTRLGRRVYFDRLIRRSDPRGRPYYWIGGDPPGGDPEPGTDIGALAGGFISITPLTLNMTSIPQMEYMARWGLDRLALGPAGAAEPGP
jgi:5'-nucleotidase